jgi:hypothetical protein
MSTVVLVHTPAQLVSEPVQLAVQLPAAHTSPEAQAFPQLPQWEASVWVSTQLPEQSVLGDKQLALTHLPASQISPD